MKGDVLLDLQNKELFVSGNVVYHENILPYRSIQPLSKWHYITPNNLDTLDSPVATCTDNESSEKGSIPPQVRRSSKEKQQPAYLSDYPNLPLQVLLTLSLNSIPFVICLLHKRFFLFP